MILRPRLASSFLVMLAATCGTITLARTSAPDAGSSRPTEPLRIMSFNVRTSGAQDGENNWDARRELFFETIARFRPTLIGFQEVRENQHDEIVARMPEFAFSGVARDDGKRRGEWALIGVRKDRFTIVKHGDFWLSEEPTVPGSKSWDAALTRLCSWARLRDRQTGRELLFANTHFDHKGVLARQHASRVISAELPKIAGDLPAILVGDFNVTEDNPAYAVLVRPDTPGAIRWIDAYRTVHPTRAVDEASFNGFKGITAGARIDFIFHTEHFHATEAAIDRFMSPEGRYPSDHYPVTAVLIQPGDAMTQ
jgi:endonuclease/exonuclease/phosphatase family metal-dependent hydrolase